MNEAQFQKRLLLEKIGSNRDLARLEAQGLQHRLSSAARVLDVGRQIIGPLGAVAGVAAGSLSKKKGAAGGLVGLAALIPVALTVAKLVGDLGKTPAPAAPPDDVPPGPGQEVDSAPPADVDSEPSAEDDAEQPATDDDEQPADSDSGPPAGNSVPPAGID